MATKTAAKQSPKAANETPVRQRLIEAGKPAKVALAAIMRKLVVLANALLKANRRWTPKSA